MTIETMVSLADAYQLLAIALRYPTQELTDGLADGSFAADLFSCMEELGIGTDGMRAAFSGIQPEGLLTAMRTEYTGLFLVPKREKVFIHESRFLYPKDANPKDYVMFVSPCALHAEQCYKDTGVRVKKELSEPSDHAATELEFMSHLYRCAAQAAADGKDERIWLLRANAFMKAHISRWFADFCAQLQQESAHPAYKAIASAARALVSLAQPCA